MWIWQYWSCFTIYWTDSMRWIANDLQIYILSVTMGRPEQAVLDRGSSFNRAGGVISGRIIFWCVASTWRVSAGKFPPLSKRFVTARCCLTPFGVSITKDTVRGFRRKTMSGQLWKMRWNQQVWGEETPKSNYSVHRE